MVNVIDYVPGSTVLHRLNPVTKLGIAAAIIIATFTADTYPMLLALLALTFALGLYARAASKLVSLLKLLVPIAVIMLVLQTAFMRQGTPVVLWMTNEGLVTGSKASLRLLGVALPLVLMLSVTKLNDLANACVEVLHVPYRYAFTFASTVHFIPVFMNDMKGIMEAQTARGVEFDVGGIVNKVRLMAPLCVPLLVSSVRKTNSAAIAAEVRGFNLRTRESGYKQYPFAASDVLALALAVALLAGAICLTVML